MTYCGSLHVLQWPCYCRQEQTSAISHGIKRLLACRRVHVPTLVLGQELQSMPGCLQSSWKKLHEGNLSGAKNTPLKFSACAIVNGTILLTLTKPNVVRILTILRHTMAVFFASKTSYLASVLTPRLLLRTSENIRRLRTILTYIKIAHASKILQFGSTKFCSTVRVAAKKQNDWPIKTRFYCNHLIHLPKR